MRLSETDTTSEQPSKPRETSRTTSQPASRHSLAPRIVRRSLNRDKPVRGYADTAALHADDAETDWTPNKRYSSTNDVEETCAKPEDCHPKIDPEVQICKAEEKPSSAVAAPLQGCSVPDRVVETPVAVAQDLNGPAALAANSSSPAGTSTTSPRVWTQQRLRSRHMYTPRSHSTTSKTAAVNTDRLSRDPNAADGEATNDEETSPVRRTLSASVTGRPTVISRSRPSIDYAGLAKRTDTPTPGSESRDEREGSPDKTNNDERDRNPGVNKYSKSSVGAEIRSAVRVVGSTPGTASRFSGRGNAGRRTRFEASPNYSANGRAFARSSLPSGVPAALAGERTSGVSRPSTTGVPSGAVKPSLRQMSPITPAKSHRALNNSALSEKQDGAASVVSAPSHHRGDGRFCNPWASCAREGLGRFGSLGSPRRAFGLRGTGLNRAPEVDLDLRAHSGERTPPDSRTGSPTSSVSSATGSSGAASVDGFQSSESHHSAVKEKKTPDEVLATMILLIRKPDFAQAKELTSRNKRALVAHWLGHSTFVLHMPGLVVVTDPVFSDRLGPTGPARLVPSPCDIEDMPERIDIVVISSACPDHFDKDAVKKIGPRVRRWVVPLGVGALLTSDSGISKDNITELDWWTDTVVPFVADDEGETDRAVQGCGDTHVVCTPAQHRSPVDSTLWASWYIMTPYKRIFFCGATGYRAMSRVDDDSRNYRQRSVTGGPRCPAFREIYHRLGSCDVAFLPIGRAAPRSTMSTHNCDAVDALFIHRDLRARHSIVHRWGTFHSGEEGMLDPIRTLENARLDAPMSEHEVEYLQHGRLHEC